tara:strand:- start:3690 stop:4622 length:933 start_codon:yes stop_codon:yes gene_type:complete
LTTKLQHHTAQNDILSEHHAEFSNAYEAQLRTDGLAIGEQAESDEALDAYRQTLKATDEQVQTALISRDRRHDLILTASFVCWVKTAEQSPGYIDGLLGESDVKIAPNASSAKRAKMSALIRLATGQVAARADINTRISRLSKTAVGLVMECESRGIAVHLGNVVDVIDTALEHNRSYFQKLVDAHEASSATKVDVQSTSPSSPASEAAPPNGQPHTPQKPELGNNNGNASEEASAAPSAPLRLLPTPSTASPVLPAVIGKLPNDAGLDQDYFIMLGHVRGDTIVVRGPIVSTQADEVLRALEKAYQSAA